MIMKKIVLIGLVVILSGCFGTEPQKTGKEGKPVPEFSVLLTDSINWVHAKDIPTNKPFVLLYFSPYCHFCKAQTKTIIENIDNLKGIQFYYLSSFPLSTLKTFSKEFDLAKYPNITIGFDSASIVSDYFEIPAYPYIAIYGKDKKLKKSFVGKIYTSQIKKIAQE
jgi:thiol-disulfide isomerase/thioredoxin